MWLLLHSSRTPLRVFRYVRLLKRCCSSQSRPFSSTPIRPGSDQALADRPQLPLENNTDLRSTFSATDHDLWTKQALLNTVGQSPMIAPSTQSQPQWQESLSKDDALLQQKKTQQLRLEQNFVYEALEEYRKFVLNARRREQVAKLPAARGLVNEWFTHLNKAIQQEQQKILISRRTVQEAKQNLLLLEPDELTLLTIHSVLGTMLKKRENETNENCVTLLEVASKLGRAVQAQVNLLKLRQRVESENKRRHALNKYISQISNNQSAENSASQPLKLAEWEKRLVTRAMDMETKIRYIRNRWNSKQVRIKDVMRDQFSLNKEQTKWDEGILVQIGVLLFDLFKKTAIVKIDKTTGKIMGQMATSVCSDEPILKHEVIWQRKAKQRSLGIVTVHPAVMRAIEASEMNTSLFLARAQPMVYPPLEWQAYDNGGYLWTSSRVIRCYENTEPALLVKEADQKNRLTEVYKALTVLGRTPWAMNKDIFAVVEDVWKAGGGKLGLPSRTNVPMPQVLGPRYRLQNDNGALCATFSGDTAQETFFRDREVKLAEKKNAELHSLRCDVELKLAVARQFLDEERIYYPHNMDFRGRAYPIPPHLNHLGNDMCRGLLLFADAKPLGKDGLDWLYIQVANLYGSGENKKKLEERKQFGIQSLDSILDSANNPLSGLQWWMSGDSPWQLLATCMEIRNALKSDNPESYLSRMHVHQDGSCNGLQHYAALGRDTSGAGAVNLRSCDAPNDVYSEVCQVVAGIVAEDAAKGHQWAKILHGHVDRKLVKQTVMTSVYGVTFIGAREQIANRLKERGWDDDRRLFNVSTYAANVTMTGLHRKFHNAKDVMRWLADCARVIASSGETVKWTTPLGLTAGQPYRNREKHSVSTVLQNLSLVRNSTNLPVIKRRQKSAFPPNYVHSLDSTHMMMTALGCDERNVTFAGVHDSFWTHAGSVTEMNRIIRQKFYELHSQPLLERLLMELKETYQEKDLKFPRLPELGDFDLKEIIDATYFFN